MLRDNPREHHRHGYREPRGEPSCWHLGTTSTIGYIDSDWTGPAISPNTPQLPVSLLPISPVVYLVSLVVCVPCMHGYHVPIKYWCSAVELCMSSREKLWYTVKYIMRPPIINYLFPFLVPTETIKSMRVGGCLEYVIWFWKADTIDISRNPNLKYWNQCSFLVLDYSHARYTVYQEQSFS